MVRTFDGRDSEVSDDSKVKRKSSGSKTSNRKKTSDYYSETSDDEPVRKVKERKKTSDKQTSDDSDDEPVRKIRNHKKTKYWKKFHRRKLKIVPQLPPAHGLLNAIQRAASNPRYRASQVSHFHPTGNSHQIMAPCTKGVRPFSQY
jgi:hypothetical protein